MELNKYIDHTVLKPITTTADIKKLCQEAIEHKFFSVCVNPCYVALANELLKGTDVKIACVVGFPLGANRTDMKVLEAVKAVEDGASEIDMVINVGALKEGNYELVLDEINQIREKSGVLLKVIIETSQLTQEEVIKMCEIVNQSKAECIKTSTGFVGGGAELETVKLMCSLMNEDKFVKASGGIRDKEAALKMVEVGAKRLGTSSGIKIVS
ncbi:MAG: deoxyribose-phosphate aldolase [Clostridia bacterium]|nr:deoxyribose-phosphate aldolase [Clostridia bacterium]